MKLKIFLLILLIPSFLSSEDVRISYIPYNPGMFSVLNTILGAVEKLEKGEYQGLSVDLGNTGLYYEKKKGNNWFEYYFEPIKFNLTEKPRDLTGKECGHLAMKTECAMTRESAYNLLYNYFVVKSDINFEVTNFSDKYFRDKYVIGVHYRGTDKGSEAPKVKYEAMLGEIVQQLRLTKSSDIAIFIATDEKKFLDYMKAQFPGLVIYQKAIRSKDRKAVHYRSKDRFIVGKQALIDSLLLSECNVLIRTTSNLSLWAGFFNPSLPIITLNRRY